MSTPGARRRRRATGLAPTATRTHRGGGGRQCRGLSAVAAARRDVRRADRLPAGRRATGCARSPSRRRAVLPRRAWCTRWCTAVRRGRSACSSSPRAAVSPSEAVGVRTGVPFGDYSYSSTLGPQVLDVPARRTAGLDDDGLPGAARGPAPDPALGAAVVGCLRAGRRGTCSSTRRWSPTAAGPGPTRRRRCPASPGVPLTNYAGWLAVGVRADAAAHRPAAARRLPGRRRVGARGAAGVDLGRATSWATCSGSVSRRRPSSVASCSACSWSPTRGRCGSRGPDALGRPALGAALAVAGTVHAVWNARRLRVATGRPAAGRRTGRRAAPGARRGAPRRALPAVVAGPARPARRAHPGARRRVERRHGRRRTPGGRRRSARRAADRRTGAGRLVGQAVGLPAAGRRRDRDRAATGRPRLRRRRCRARAARGRGRGRAAALERAGPGVAVPATGRGQRGGAAGAAAAAVVVAHDAAAAGRASGRPGRRWPRRTASCSSSTPVPTGRPVATPRCAPSRSRTSRCCARSSGPAAAAVSSTAPAWRPAGCTTGGRRCATATRSRCGRRSGRPPELLRCSAFSGSPTCCRRSRRCAGRGPGWPATRRRWRAGWSLPGVPEDGPGRTLSRTRRRSWPSVSCSPTRGAAGAPGSSPSAGVACPLTVTPAAAARPAWPGPARCRPW